MKCLVTGGAGFIGSHVVERLLADGHEVTILDDFSTGSHKNLKGIVDNQKCWFYRKDISTDSLDKRFRDIDWVFHLAGKADIVPSIQNPEGYFNSNTLGTMRVMEACRKTGVKKVIYAASSSCYGDNPAIPTRENWEGINPKYPYALTKYLGEQIVLHWSQLYHIPALSLRLFNVYGLRSRTSGAYGAVLGIFLKQKLEGQPATVVGSGDQTRDFVYVTDVADAFVSAAESRYHSKPINIGGGNPQSINKLVSLLGFKDTIQIPERPGEPLITHADISRARTAIGWMPQITFEEGVEKVLEHIEDWRDAPLWTPETIKEATKDWFEHLGG